MDVNSDGSLDAGDLFVASTSTMIDGLYEFETYSLETDYLVVLDQQTLPASTELTINNEQQLIFSQLNEGDI